MKLNETNLGNKLRLCSLICFFIFLSNQLTAQTYLQGRMGYVHQPYKPLNPEILNRDEHDYLGGFMLDFEIGKQLKTKKVTFLFGIRIQQIIDVKGIYTQYQINPDVDINVYRTSFFLTAGLKIPIVKKMSLITQFNYGPKYTLWYEDGEFKDSFWSCNIPLDVGFEFPINNKLNILCGTSNTLPIYTSRTHIFYCGITAKII